ncbi:MAG: UPF0489 family protein [Coriobacteriia bacterium]|nr:UPF0489 family protein [Coriobacteriia bacterium]
MTRYNVRLNWGGALVAVVLDLDLDFFAEGIVEFGFDVKPTLPPLWSESVFVQFLEERCGLSRATPVPGRIFEDHNEALCFWRDLLAGGLIAAPFHVVHVDAHADLGHDGGQNWVSWVEHLSVRVLGRPQNERDNRVEDEPFENEVNYLLFAAARRWLSELTFVTHPDMGSDYRIPTDFCPLLGTGERVIELGQWDPDLFKDRTGMRLDGAKPERCEPPVPIRIVEGTDFRLDQPVVVASLALSPEYTRQDTRLPDIFRRYITVFPSV